LETIQHSPPSIGTHRSLVPSDELRSHIRDARALKMRRGERHLVWLKSPVVARK